MVMWHHHLYHSSWYSTIQRRLRQRDNEEGQNMSDIVEDLQDKPSTETTQEQQPDETKMVTTYDKKKNIIHNHYYNSQGNGDIAKMLSKMMEEQKQNLNTDQGFLLQEDEQCRDINMKLKTLSKAELENNRYLQDLQQRCSKGYNGSKCLFSSSQSQTSLIGTLLKDASDTKFGSIINEEDIDIGRLKR